MFETADFDPRLESFQHTHYLERRKFQIVGPKKCNDAQQNCLTSTDYSNVVLFKCSGTDSRMEGSNTASFKYLGQ